MDLILAYCLMNIAGIKQQLYYNFPKLEIELKDNVPKEIDPWVVTGLYPEKILYIFMIYLKMILLSFHLKKIIF